VNDCTLCNPANEAVLWYDNRCRITEVNNNDYPGYCRVIWHAHVREMSDLSVDDRRHLYFVVETVEEALRRVVRPDKINLASLGNQVPHLHWHVIPRFANDPHFPDPIWATPHRQAVPRSFDRMTLQRELVRRLAE
jgi:diadenosine tetraphosphate (Ap4A) HIT family hydrolase